MKFRFQEMAYLQDFFEFGNDDQEECFVNGGFSEY